MSASSTPSLEDMRKIAADSIGVIERDSGQILDERLRRVVEHWMVRAMADVRTRTLAAHKAELSDIVQRIAAEIAATR